MKYMNKGDIYTYSCYIKGILTISEVKICNPWDYQFHYIDGDSFTLISHIFRGEL